MSHPTEREKKEIKGGPFGLKEKDVVSITHPHPPKLQT
jgi:hypothetical protein